MGYPPLFSGAQVAPFGWATWIALAVLLLAVLVMAHFPARPPAVPRAPSRRRARIEL
ncbi:hypothetical protein [Metallibacterium sp.]|uniref:hypothetical protein n=1 Tax=Metallibacterium sp. TaxID=2940281 RepID=UPI00261AB90D|nr:hypothetical protein [Metallibacterium sp.]